MQLAQFNEIPKETEMSAPYFVQIKATNSEGVEWTVVTQRCESYEDFVLYQKALLTGVIGLADEAVAIKKGGNPKTPR